MSLFQNATGCRAKPFCIQSMLKCGKELGNKMLQCDNCDRWFHFVCEGYLLADEIKKVGQDNYVCRRYC